MHRRNYRCVAIAGAVVASVLFPLLSHAAGPAASGPTGPTQQLQPLQLPPAASVTPSPGLALKPHTLESDRDMIIHTLDTVTALVGDLKVVQTEIVQVQQKLDALRAEANQKLDALSFQIRTPAGWSRRLPPAQRWELVFDNQAVVDRETGLVWERSPGTWSGIWGFALSQCPGKTIGPFVRGWRLPSVAELQTLFPLPSGHPFANASRAFWASTVPHNEHPGDPRFPPQAYFVSDSDWGSLDQSDPHPVWCVRGGQETFTTRP